VKSFRLAHLAALAAAIFPLSGPLGARTFDVGAVVNSVDERTYLRLPIVIGDDAIRSASAVRSNVLTDVPGMAPPDVESRSVSLNSIVAGAAGVPFLPWAARSLYSFADMVPTVPKGSTLSGSMRTYYKDVLTIAAAPTPENWLCILIGLGLVAFQLRRTQRLLQHRPLAD
jgi:hypothetical protein